MKPILESELTGILQQYVEELALQMHTHGFLSINSKDLNDVGDRAIGNNLLEVLP